MRSPEVIITSARMIADVLDLGGRREAASIMRELCDGIEALAARVLEYRETIELCAHIVEGSTEAPSQYEIATHARNGGRWLLSIERDGRHLVYVLDAGADDARAEARAGTRENVRWWALDKTGTPCRRPRSGR
jgi:hypothetical protein